MRYAATQVLHRLGILGPAYRFYEALKGLELRRPISWPSSGLGPDGLPVPPAKLIVLVGGTTNVPAFLEGGRAIAQGIREILETHGVTLDHFGRILDFGCGCGRVVRQWQALAHTEVHGTDYNPELVQWCRENLDFAHFRLNRLDPPLGYRGEYFDFVYAFSVFTHLTHDLQIRWRDELARVLKPGGYLLITTHGTHYLDAMTPRERVAFAAGELVVRYEKVAGTNLCTAFHPEQYVRDTLAQSLRLIDYVPHRVDQDFILLHKPKEPSANRRE